MKVSVSLPVRLSLHERYCPISGQKWNKTWQKAGKHTMHEETNSSEQTRTATNGLCADCEAASSCKAMRQWCVFTKGDDFGWGRKTYQKILHLNVTTGLRLFCSVAMRRTGRVLGAKTLEPLCSRLGHLFFSWFRRWCILHGAGASGYCHWYRKPCTGRNTYMSIWNSGEKRRSLEVLVRWFNFLFTWDDLLDPACLLWCKQSS